MKLGDSFVVGTMKHLFQSSEKRSELSAVTIVIAVLAVGALAKSDMATQLFHLTH